MYVTHACPAEHVLWLAGASFFRGHASTDPSSELSWHLVPAFLLPPTCQTSPTTVALESTVVSPGVRDCHYEAPIFNPLLFRHSSLSRGPRLCTLDPSRAIRDRSKPSTFLRTTRTRACAPRECSKIQLDTTEYIQFLNKTV